MFPPCGVIFLLAHLSHRLVPPVFRSVSCCFDFFLCSKSDYKLLITFDSLLWFLSHSGANIILVFFIATLLPFREKCIRNNFHSLHLFLCLGDLNQSFKKDCSLKNPASASCVQSGRDSKWTVFILLTCSKCFFTTLHSPVHTGGSQDMLQNVYGWKYWTCFKQHIQNGGQGCLLTAVCHSLDFCTCISYVLLSHFSYIWWLLFCSLYILLSFRSLYFLPCVSTPVLHLPDSYCVHLHLIMSTYLSLNCPTPGALIRPGVSARLNLSCRVFFGTCRSASFCIAVTLSELFCTACWFSSTSEFCCHFVLFVFPAELMLGILSLFLLVSDFLCLFGINLWTVHLTRVLHLGPDLPLTVTMSNTK